ncbi:MAG: hypothetical protein ACREQ5_04235, partial [Candidatus Dormibacteria bacterium]
ALISQASNDGVSMGDVIAAIVTAFPSGVSIPSLYTNGMTTPDQNGLVQFEDIDTWKAQLAKNTDSKSQFMLTQFPSEGYACMPALALLQAGSAVWWTVNLAIKNLDWFTAMGLVDSLGVRIVSLNPDPTATNRFITSSNHLPYNQASIIPNKYASVSDCVSFIKDLVNKAIPPASGSGGFSPAS